MQCEGQMLLSQGKQSQACPEQLYMEYAVLYRHPAMQDTNILFALVLKTNERYIDLLNNTSIGRDTMHKCIVTKGLELRANCNRLMCVITRQVPGYTPVAVEFAGTHCCGCNGIPREPVQ